MKRILFYSGVLIMISSMLNAKEIPSPYTKVDQVIWVVSDLENTIKKYEELGFTQVLNLGIAQVESKSNKGNTSVKLARANLAGAIVNWIQPLEGKSIFQELLNTHNDAAVSLVHRFHEEKELNKEISRLNNLGVEKLEKVALKTKKGVLNYVFMDTGEKGKYILGFTYENDPMQIQELLNTENRHNMEFSQYAFAIRNPEDVSVFWEGIGLPAFQINHPQLGEPKYYGEPVDHEMIQGWQWHGTIGYEWCIPVKPPIVYEDHIKKHGEGIHHLGFKVNDMDGALDDFRSRGFVVSMGGTWGEKGKPGSGRYEYIDMEKAGGLTIELLWNYKE